MLCYFEDTSMKIKKLFPVIISSLSILLGGLAFISASSNSEVKKASATDNMNNGLFVRVEDPNSNLSSGDKVIFVVDDLDAEDIVHRAISAPKSNGYIETCAMGDEYSHFYSERKDNKSYYRYVLANCEAEIFSVEAGSVENSFAFRGTNAFYGYLAKTNSGGQLGVSNSKNNNSSWDFQGYGEFARKTLLFHNKGSEGYISFGGYGSFGEDLKFEVSHKNGYFHVFKQISDYTAEINTAPNRITYYMYDAVDYTGLTFLFKRGDEFSFVVDSADFAKLYVGDTNVMSNKVDLYIFNDEPYRIYLYFSVNLVDRSGSYSLCGALPADKRGTYHFVREYPAEVPQHFIFNPLFDEVETDKRGNYNPVNIVNNKINAESSTYTYLDHLAVITITREVVNEQSNYYYKTSNNKYLAMRGEYDNYSLYLSDTPTSVAILEGARVIKLRDHGVTRVLVFSLDSSLNNYGFRFVPESEAITVKNTPACLYKRDFTESEDPKMTTFKDSFISITSQCKEDGKSLTITKEEWSLLAGLFNDISEDAKGYFGSLSYTHNKESKNSDRDLMDRYDYIVSKYGYSDFINRKDSNTYRNNYSYQISDPIINESDSSIIAMIIVASVLEVVSLSFIFYFKRRRYNRTHK